MQGYWNPDAELQAELIHARLMSLIPPPPPHRGEPLNEWAARHNADWYAQQRRLDEVNREAWAALSSEYVEAD